MNINGKISIKESKTKMTTSALMRLAGVSAMAAGIIFAGIQPIHPPDFLPSVTTTAWATIMPVKLLMCLLFLLGFAGLYARQVEETGWLGLAGFLMLSVTWVLQAAFIFAETFILPVLVVPSPQFVESFLGIVNGFPGEMNIGALPAVYGLAGLLYMLGGLLFGIATFRAAILPRWAAGLLAVAAMVTPAAALLPHAIQRFAGIPVGIAVALLGYTLFSERRVKSLQAVPDQRTASPEPSKVA
ncbi:MAG TPA: hypothetical protein PLD25_13185 [Chloroflexota bacterium]|nr:hypothetical protein [Chloroflexota bacterium]HUM67853.1 hypothetical protein [Chloroflexota bacterium]